MTLINFYSEENDFKIITEELSKAGLDISTSYEFKYLNWIFTRTRKHWKVNTTPEFGFTIEQGMKLHETKFPIEMFDEPKNSLYGHYIRLAGHAGAPSPKSDNGIWSREGCIKYHIDNQCAFNFFVSFLKDNYFEEIMKM